MEIEISENKKEKINTKIKGFVIEDVINKKLIDEMRKRTPKGDKIIPIGLIFIDENPDVKKADFIVINHETRKDLIDKIVVVKSDNAELMKIFTEALKTL